MTAHPQLNASLTCHACGGVMERDARPTAISYKGETMTIDLPGWYCASCGEAVLSANDMAVSDQALHEIKLRVEGLLAPEEVRNIRKHLKLSQRKAGAILGGGPRAFQKYESGITLVSRPMSNLLRLLDHDPARLKELGEESG